MKRNKNLRWKLAALLVVLMAFGILFTAIAAEAIGISVPNQAGTITIINIMEYEFPDSMDEIERDEYREEGREQGFEINVKGPNGFDENHTIRVNDDPQLTLMGMAYGKYEVTEVSIPLGYVNIGINGGSFTLGCHNKDVTVTISNKIVLHEFY